MENFDREIKFSKLVGTLGVIAYLMSFSAIGIGQLGFEYSAYGFVILFCVLNVKNGPTNAKRAGGEFNIYSIIPYIFLIIESSLSIILLNSNSEWIVDTDIKGSKYKNFMNGLKNIFIIQILLTQASIKNIPIVSLNILLFIIWLFVYIIFSKMLENQKIV